MNAQKDKQKEKLFYLLLTFLMVDRQKQEKPKTRMAATFSIWTSSLCKYYEMFIYRIGSTLPLCQITVPMNLCYPVLLVKKKKLECT